MRFLLLITLLSITIFSACKKSSTHPYIFTVTTNGYTDTIKNVSMQNDGAGGVSILATDYNNDVTTTLAITNYLQGDHEYNIISTYVGGVNYGSSSATYRKGNLIIFSVSGNITVTGYPSGIMTGTFDFQSADGRATGTFSAPAP